MSIFHSVSRFFVVWYVLIKYGIDQLIPKTSLHPLLLVVTYMMPSAWGRRLDTPPAQRLKEALEALGPIYIKFGQAISTRPDLLPPEYAKELAKLQDDVAPFSREQAIEIIEKSLKKPVSEAFLQFNSEVLASASMAQVHSAVLHTGEAVVVKVIRPNIEKTIRQDLTLMYLFANIINKLSKETRRLHLPEVVTEFDKTISDELDLLQEAANGSLLRQNFLDSEILYVPKIHWDYCTKKVLVMERVSGYSINDVAAMKAAGVNLKKLAAHGVTIFFTQVFYHKYFHADMHPGNIFIDGSDPENPKYISIDFGIVASLNDKDQFYLAENFLAFFNRDYRRVAQLHIDSGWIPKTVKVTDFEAAIRKASEPIFGRPLKDISFAQFLLTLFQTARRYEMEVQPQLVLLQKTFFNIEGLGRVLYPELDLWETGKPILERWMRDELSIKKTLTEIRNHAGEYRQIAIEMPMLLNQQLKTQKQARQKNAQLIASSILSGFLGLLVLSPDLWGAPWSRYVLLLLLGLMLYRLGRLVFRESEHF